jgi:hypothetical protein
MLDKADANMALMASGLTEVVAVILADSLLQGIDELKVIRIE